MSQSAASAKSFSCPVCGFAGLTAGTADVNVMGHAAWRSDLKAFEGVYGYPPLEIMFATGGFDKGKGNTPGVIFFVNNENPLSGLTLKQLDGIFGAQRTGGWNGSKFFPICPSTCGSITLNCG